MVASLSENFGSGTRKLPWQFYFGVYPQTDASGVQYEPIEWRLLSYDDNESSEAYTNFYDYLHIILPSKAITAFPDLLQSAPTAMPYSWMTVFNAI